MSFGQLLTSFCHNKKWNCVSLTCGAMEVQVERSTLEEEELEADDAQRQEYYNGIIDDNEVDPDDDSSYSDVDY